MLPKLPSFPERPITSQMVKSLQDQTDAAEAQNFRQYKSSGSSHQSKAIKRVFKLTAQKWLITTAIFNPLAENCLLDRQFKRSCVRRF